MGLENCTVETTLNSCSKLDIRNYPFDGWNLWLSEFKKHVGPSFDIWPNSEKVEYFLKKMGPDANIIFQTFNVGNNVAYEELVRLFEDYFSPLFSRYKFFNRKQKANESFDEFADSLAILSFPCHFGSLQGSLVRDIFVCNLHESFEKLRKKMLKEKDPTLSQLILIAKTQSTTANGMSLLRHCNSSASENNYSTDNLNGSMDRLALSSNKTIKRDSSPNEKIPSSSCTSNCVNNVKSGVSSRLSKFRPTSSKPTESIGPCDRASSNCEKLNVAKGTSTGRMTISQVLKNHDLANKKKSESEQVITKTEVHLKEKVNSTDETKSQLDSEVTNDTTSGAKDERDLSNQTRKENKDKIKSNVDNTSQNSDKMLVVPITATAHGEVDQNQSNFPLPEDMFSTVVVVYIPESGKPVYVCHENKIVLMQEIESKLDELASNNVLEEVTDIERNTKYAAPWQQHWYRAEIVTVQWKQQTVTAYFCDYGNTETVSLNDLRQLPSRLKDLEAIGIPIQLPVNVEFPIVTYGSRLRVKPMFLEGGTLVIELAAK